MVVDTFENEKQFLKIRHQIIHQQVHQQKPEQSRTITANDETKNEAGGNTIIELPVTAEKKWKRNLIIHFQYEQRMKSCQK